MSGPSSRKSVMRFGFSGTEMSNSSTPAGFSPAFCRLVGDRHDVADRLQRIGAHLRLRQVGARDDLRVLRVGDIDRGEVLRRALMRQPQDAPAVLGELHRHAFAHAAEAVERVVRRADACSTLLAMECSSFASDQRWASSPPRSSARARAAWVGRKARTRLLRPWSGPPLPGARRSRRRRSIAMPLTTQKPATAISTMPAKTPGESAKREAGDHRAAEARRRPSASR